MFGTAALSNDFRLAIIAITSLLLASCTSSSSQKGGDCFYDYISTHAEVIEMKPGPEGTIKIILDFDASKLALEDQELGALKDIRIDHDFLVRNNIELGNKYSVEVSEITKGDCVPLFVSFNHSFK